MDKSTISLETDRDKDISTLSYTKAKCLVNIRAGFCCASECESCRTGQRFTACYNSLPVCDQLNVDNQAGQIAAVMYEQVGNNKDSKVWHAALVAFLITAILGIVATTVSVYKDTQPYRPTATYSLDRNQTYALCKPVYDIMEQIGVWDINHDKKINCIDNAILFKLLWDSMHAPGNCQIIENHTDETDYHHLFNRVRVAWQSDWVIIEPQQHSINTFMKLVKSQDRDERNDEEATARWLLEISTGIITENQYTKIKGIIGE